MQFLKTTHQRSDALRMLSRDSLAIFILQILAPVIYSADISVEDPSAPIIYRTDISVEDHGGSYKDATFWPDQFPGPVSDSSDAVCYRSLPSISNLTVQSRTVTVLISTDCPGANGS
ncbi:hypothetical protein F4604DRAFT_1689611 [Suillus subluteus]|nr:hypothetical protein F4604DRAFT_1689611 [Suillus subluteus]